jgi:hypothetical protein
MIRFRPTLSAVYGSISLMRIDYDRLEKFPALATTLWP